MFRRILAVFGFIFFLTAHGNPVTKDIKKDIDHGLNEITPKEKSPLEKRTENQQKLSLIPNFYSLYKMNFLYPFYYTSHPAKNIYRGFTPDNQTIKPYDFKGQVSVSVPIINHLFWQKDLSLHGAFTELVYWQFYSRSQFFRETDTEATVFLQYHFYRNWLSQLAIDHQSNGKGGELERSWNRVIGTLQFSSGRFYFQGDAWFLIFTDESIALHNPDIEKYLGHEKLTFAYKLYDVTVAASVQNLESLFRRVNTEIMVMYPVGPHINLSAQYYNGHGQSLVEYNSFTNAFGVGITFNNFL